MDKPAVRLVGMTTPAAPEFGATPQEFLAYCARVSSAANQPNHDTGLRLLRSLIRRKEWSPLEMGSATIEITTTRDIARQLLRHRSFSFQEFSQRYAAVIDFAEPREARLQDPKDRQNSIEEGVPTTVKRSWLSYQQSIRAESRNAYEWALSVGIAKEVARSVLPEGMTSSRLYMAGTFRSWAHYIELRGGRETQKEHRDIAAACRVELQRELPDLFNAIEEQRHG